VFPEASRCERWQHLIEQAGPLLLTPQDAPDFLGQVTRLGHDLYQLVEEDLDLALFHVVHRVAHELENYGVLHAVQTAILVAMVGQRKSWKPAYTCGAVRAALTMNLSITALQNTLAGQETPLNAAQQQAIHEHPIESQKALRRLGVIDELWLRAVAQHHEHPQGSSSLQKQSELTPWAEVLRTCDVFGARISPRAHRRGLLMGETADALLRQAATAPFGSTIARELSLYPPGSLVRLCSGETAMILRRTRSPMRPEICVLTDSRGRALERPQRCMSGHPASRTVLTTVHDPDLASRFSTTELFGSL